MTWKEMMWHDIMARRNWNSNYAHQGVKCNLLFSFARFRSHCLSLFCVLLFLFWCVNKRLSKQIPSHSPTLLRDWATIFNKSQGTKSKHKVKVLISIYKSIYDFYGRMILIKLNYTKGNNIGNLAFIRGESFIEGRFFFCKNGKKLPNLFRNRWFSVTTFLQQ